MSEAATTFDEAFDTLAQLSTAHTQFMAAHFPQDTNDVDVGQAESLDELMLAEQEGSDDFGFYKESDIAIWALSREMYDDLTILVAARLNRINVLDANPDGIAFDAFLMARSHGEQQRIKVAWQLGRRIIPGVVDYLEPEFFLPSLAEVELVEAFGDHSEHSERRAEVKEFSVETWERLEHCEEPALVALIESATALSIDQRYVGYDISESEVKSGQEGSEQLFALLESWVSRLSDGSWQHITINNEQDEAVEDEQSETGDFEEVWALPHYNGNMVKVSRYPRQETHSSVVSKRLQEHVSPPTILKVIPESNPDYIYVIQITDLYADEVRVIEVDARSSTSHQYIMSIDELYTATRLTNYGDRMHLNQFLSWGMQHRSSEITRSPRYLNDAEIAEFLSFLEDEELFLTVLVDGSVVYFAPDAGIDYELTPITDDQRAQLQRLIDDPDITDTARALLEWRLEAE